ncbi:MAG TPA: protease modulator HflK [Gemmatimonadaceae bacterium]|nr:protease modulator HflK [Gemmatimonadaceae bacterium]
MRRLGPPSEIGRLAAPIAGLLDGAWQRMHWWVGAMGVLYLLSGITVVRANEVAVVLRWGRLVGDTPALQAHGPGLLFAFPRPVDEVVRVQVKRVLEVAVKTLAPSEDEQISGANGVTLNPLTEGYALTGDLNIVHVEMMARYRVRDPGEWAFYGPKAEDVLRVEVTSAMVQSLGEMGVDRVLSDGREALIATAAKRAQAGLDSAHAGLELTSLELTRLIPPLALAYDFSAVQSAFTGAETKKKEAQAFAATAIPDANAQADAAVQTARATAASDLAQAQGETEAFRALDKEYRANPAVVRERLYRDAVGKAIAASVVRWVPPPVDGSYHGFRITLPSSSGGVGHALLPDTGGFSPPRP